MEGEKPNVGDGNGPISWSTGIAEVALPIDYKLQNIEATELARKRIENHFRSERKNNALSGADSRCSNRQMSTDDKTLERFRKRLQR